MPTCGTIEVTPRFDANNVSVSACAGNADVERGQSVGVTATIQNTNDAAANASIRLQVGSNTVGSTSTTVAANSSRQVQFTVDTADLSPGDYRARVELTGAQRA